MTSPLGKTIQSLLPDGNPRGVKIAEFTSRTVHVVLVPRAQLEFACTRPELSNVGVYFLFGDAGGGNIAQLYVGEPEDCNSRLRQHNKTKDWWTTAVVCVSKTAGFTKSHVKYLEWYCHQEATAAGRFKVDNSSIPTKSHVSEPMEADLMDHFDTIRILTGTLGFPLFERIQKPHAKDRLFCKGKRALANGEYTEDGLVVFAGSISNRPEAKSINEYITTLRQHLIAHGVLEVVDEDTLRFKKDHVFPSPSQAAGVVLARNANGWVEWKYSDGRTLDKVKRRSET